jgi:uncharacterized protein
MVYLLDVNLLIALIDIRHIHNEIAHRWVAGHSESLNWATCPLVENAFVRILGNPSYPNSPGTAGAALSLLRENCSSPKHTFWPDDVSICDDTLFANPALIGSAQVTDLYLLALAVKKGGKLASFDRRIPAHLIRGGKEALHLLTN